jgi:membrane-bound serine protease (ClpP class)
MLIIAGIYFEFQVPGFGFPSVIAITAAVLYFAPLYLDGLAANWEILLFVVGLILLALEIFIIPGFGITGILGILSIFCGLVLSLIGNNAFNFDSVEGSDVLHAVIMVLSSLIFSALLMLYISSKIGSKGIFKKVALGANQMKEEGYIAVPTINKTLVGKTGTVYSDLRPSGKVSIDNNVVDAISEEGYIEKGKLVVVNKYESGQVYVSKKE